MLQEADQRKNLPFVVFLFGSQFSISLRMHSNVSSGKQISIQLVSRVIHKKLGRWKVPLLFNKLKVPQVLHIP